MAKERAAVVAFPAPAPRTGVLALAEAVLAEAGYGIRPDEAWWDYDPRAGGTVLCVAYDTGIAWRVVFRTRRGREEVEETDIPVRRVLEFRREAERDGDGVRVRWRFVRTLAVVPPVLLRPDLFLTPPTVDVGVRVRSGKDGRKVVELDRVRAVDPEDLELEETVR